MNMLVLTLQEYEFKKQFNENKPSNGCRKTGKNLSCFLLCMLPLYLVVDTLMNKRAKFELRKPLVLWSLTLALFSIFGALRTGAYMVNHIWCS
uniref:very-long-chain 3-oxoacyl-CoA synthase n=1 Tax=Prolemur simus TaxID=1328070 RepID=A0A8C8Z8X7_PROSS